jgi:AraC family transcriptional regulator
MRKRIGARRPAGSFYGTLVAAKNVRGWGFSESIFTEGTITPLHTHDVAFFYLVVSGSCQESFRNTERVSSPPSLIFHPVGEPHRNRWKGLEGRSFNIEIGCRCASLLDSNCPLVKEPVSFEGGQPLWIAQCMSREFRLFDPFSSLALEGLAMELVAACSRALGRCEERTVPNWLRRVRDMLQEHLSGRLGLSELSATAGVHPSHLARSFRKHFRCSIGEYQRKARIQRAMEKLTSSTAPISEMALELGFFDQSHFSRAFKCEIGISPRQFQRLHRPGAPDTSE